MTGVDDMVTIKKIAEKCGVSATTVSNILNGKAKASEATVQQVMQAVREMGYQPNSIARGLRSNSTRMIGIIVEDIAQFTTPDIIESIMEYCEEKGYRTLIQNLRLYARWQDSWYNRESDYYSILEPVLKDLISMKVDGIIYVAGHARVIKAFSDHTTVPSVMAYAYSGSQKVPSVVIDDEQSAYEAVKYLLDMGHRDIGVIGGRMDNIHTQKRLLGIQKALFEAQVLFDPEMIFYGDWERGSGYQGAEILIGKGAEAIFCMADRMAGGVYDYLEEHHMKAGTDISVVGFDDWEGAAFAIPKLTTARLPLNQVGRTSAELLFQMIEENRGAEAHEIKIPCKMQIRQSVRKYTEDH